MKILRNNYKTKTLTLVVVIFLICANFFPFSRILDNLDQCYSDAMDISPKGSSSATDFEYAWDSTWGGIYDDVGTEVATDSQNNVYLVGYTDTTGSDNCDIVFAKYSINGQEMWVKTWGGSNDDKGYGIYIDASDNIYIVGCTKSFGDTDGDIVIINYDTSGNQIFNKTWGGPQNDYGKHIFEDALGNFYVSGFTSSFGDIDGDAWIIKFNNLFEEQWNVTWGGSEPDVANKAEIGSNNYLYVVGHYDEDVFLLKYDLDGNFQWERTWGTSFAQRGNSLALDSNDNIYITGYTFGHPSSSGKGFLLKYDSDGNYQWERIWGVSGEYGNYFYRIIIDDNDDLYISGCAKSYGIPDNYDAILLNYDTSGNQIWNKIWMGSEFDATPGICIDSFGNIYIAGNTETDSVGGTDALLIKYKNTLGPQITINSPIPNSLYGMTAPSFSISINILDYNFTWYSLDGGTTNIYSNETIGTISQSEWDKQSNGTVTISFYANNSLGNVGQSDVTIRKDILAPLITINSPSENQVCGVSAPDFDLTILEAEMDSTWYTLDYGATNTSFTGSTGTINQNEWAKNGEGVVTIRFYANDTFGNEDFSNVSVVKDLTSPIVSIISPDPFEVFGKPSPNYNITIIESNPDLMWYTLDSGATNVTFSSLNGIIDQTEWSKQGNGTVTIGFYSRDEGGNEGYAEIIVRKNISDPILIVNTPIEFEVFGITAPFFNVTVIEPDFDTMWYTLDDGLINITASGFTGDISQTEWNKKIGGIVNIIFYANDTLGNNGYAEIAVEKDITDPIVQVNLPIGDTIFGYNAPSYDISITEPNIDSMWYTLDNGLTNISVSSITGNLNQTEWNKLLHGLVSLIFYVNDTVGQLGYSTVSFNKDLNAPTTSIQFTLYNPPNLVLASTQFTFTASDNSESGVSITQYKINDSTWIPYTGAFTLVAYDSGVYTITYQSIDAVGNVEIEKFVEVELYIPPPPPPPPPDLSFLIYVALGVAVAIFGVLYVTVIRPKTAPKREIKKERKAEQARLKRKFIEQRGAEAEKLRQQQLEQQRLKRERIMRQQAERERLERERIEQVRARRELEKQRIIELEKQKQLEEERAIIEKIRIVMDVSTRIKMDLLRHYLKMDEMLFYDKIFVWAKQFGFTIDGDYLNIKKENVSDFIDELEKQFKGWRKSEGDYQGKI